MRKEANTVKRYPMSGLREQVTCFQNIPMMAPSMIVICVGTMTNHVTLAVDDAAQGRHPFQRNGECKTWCACFVAMANCLDQTALLWVQPSHGVQEILFDSL
mmetsp:Transcript_39825/g.63264  ORF Transcript_39825/g.63264 Transcript_39825/m.63264 type:complete len:102 (-) Transcript_39825:1689-1994(-)